MKGIILAGGYGTRLHPLTRITNKHLLPIYDQSMIMYPLNTLKNAGVKEMLIITGPEHAGDFLRLLGSGKDYNVKLTYKIQDQAGGIAQALGMAEDFAKGEAIAVILGDNVYEDNFNFLDFKEGAKIFLKEVPDANRFGVAEIQEDKVINIEEKPKNPKTNLAVTGLYLYDSKIFDIVKTLKPSQRGELEITDVNNAYIKENKMSFDIVKGFWSDAGTFTSLHKTIDFIKSRNGFSLKSKKPKYLILGNGFLGKKFHDFLPNSEISSARINDVKDAVKEIEKFNPDFVINCIGKTGRPNIDWCEENKLETLQGNVLAPLYILHACQQRGKKMVHISSGCIYEGDNKGEGFIEEDIPNFTGSYYSRTKTYIESILKNFNVLQLRLRMPLGSIPNERNLLTKILSYNKLVEVPNSISIVKDLLEIAKQLMDRNEIGIFNVVNKNPITHKQLLGIYQELTGKELDHTFITPEELDGITKARRSNCVLSVKKLEGLGIKVRDVQEAARECISEYIKN